MKFLLQLLYLFIVSHLSFTTADYACICNYHDGDVVVYTNPSVENLHLGSMYEFDCKPSYSPWTSLSHWHAVQFEGRVGFVALDAQIIVTTCKGVPSQIDIVKIKVTTLRSTAFSVSSHHDFSTTPTSLPTTPKRYTTSTTKILTTTILSTLTTAETATTSTEHTTMKVLQCPPLVPKTINVKQFNGHCYEFVTGVHKEWPDAERDCKRKSGHLVSIRSKPEQDFVYRSLIQLHFHGDNGVWIGFTDQNHEGRWTWVSGIGYLQK